MAEESYYLKLELNDELDLRMKQEDFDIAGAILDELKPHGPAKITYGRHPNDTQPVDKEVVLIILAVDFQRLWWEMQLEM